MSLGRPQDVSEGLHQGVGRTPLLELNIKPYRDVLITSAGDVFKTLVGDVPWHYIEDHMGTSIGRLLGTSSGRPQDVILTSGKSSLSFNFAIHRFPANDYIIFQEIWNEFRGIKKHSDFLVNHNLRK